MTSFARSNPEQKTTCQVWKMILVDLCIRKQRLQRKEQSIQDERAKRGMECIPSVISQTLNPKNAKTANPYNLSNNPDKIKSFENFRVV